jgi:hypothetical protein
MSDQPPRWGEPGYIPPPRPPRPKEPPVQQWALWIALALSILGQVAYIVGVYWGGTVCSGDPVYDHPGVALTGFLASVGALVLVGAAAWPWSALASSRFAIAVSILVVLSLGWEIILPLGAGCW